MKNDLTSHRLYVLFTAADRGADGVAVSTRQRAFGPYYAVGLTQGRVRGVTASGAVDVAALTPAGTWRALLEGEDAPAWDEFTVCAPAEWMGQAELERFDVRPGRGHKPPAAPPPGAPAPALPMPVLV
jgi:hypothetical protein